MVEHLSDDDLRMLPRGGHDYRKLYAAYKMAVEHEGSPTVILAKTVKGWTLGAGIESRNATHQIKKLTPDELRGFRDRLQIPIPDAEVDDGDPPFCHPGTDSPEFEYMMARRRTLGGSVPERVGAQKMFSVPVRDRRRERSVRRRARGHRREGAGEHHHRVRPAAAQPAARSRHRRTASCRSSPTKRARSVSTRCSATYKIYAPFGQRYEPVDAELLALVPRGEQRSHPRGGDHRSRVDGDAHRRRHGVRDVGPADDPVLHLLFDVRVPARRRPDLGVRRPARPRLPARRHRRPHHAHGRGSAALRRPEPAAARRRTRTAAAYDPAFAYEMARDHPRRHRAHVRRRSPRTASTTSPCTTRTTSMPAMPEGVEDGIVRGLYRYRAAPEASGPHRAQILASGTDDARPRSTRSRCSPTTTTSPPTCGARRATSCCARTRSSTERWNRLHPTEPPRTPYVTELLARHRRAGRRGDRLHEGGARPGRALRAQPVRRRSAPTATATPTPRVALRRHFEVDAANIVVAVLHGLAQTERGEGRGRARSDHPLRHRPRQGRPPPHVAHRPIRASGSSPSYPAVY